MNETKINLPKPGDSLPFVVAEWEGEMNSQFKLYYDERGVPRYEEKGPRVGHNWKRVVINPDDLMRMVGAPSSVVVACPTVAPTDGGGE